MGNRVKITAAAVIAVGIVLAGVWYSGGSRVSGGGVSDSGSAGSGGGVSNSGSGGSGGGVSQSGSGTTNPTTPSTGFSDY